MVLWSSTTKSLAASPKKKSTDKASSKLSYNHLNLAN